MSTAMKTGRCEFRRSFTRVGPRSGVQTRHWRCSRQGVGTELVPPSPAAQAHGEVQSQLTLLCAQHRAMVRTSMQGRLRTLLAPLDGAPVECDGFARLATTVLQQAGIPHRICCGAVVYQGHHVKPHFWLEDPQGTVWRADYRLRMWFPAEMAAGLPHGVVSLPVESPVAYTLLESVDLPPLPPRLFVLLAAPMPDLRDAWPGEAG